MKKFLFSFLFLIINYSLLITNCLPQSGWFLVTTPFNDLYLNRIQFTSPNTGYAIGPVGNSFHGYLFKTINGGTNWQPISIDSMWCWSLFFIDNNTGFMVGEGMVTKSGAIKKTTNGGLNWFNVLVGLSNDFFSIYFVDNNTGYAGGKYGVVVKTTNGGISWVSKPGAIGSVVFNDVYFFNANTGFVTGLKINKTTNGGDNWYICDYYNDDYTSIFFVNNTTGYICAGYSGSILKTTDSGENWFYVSTISQGLNSIFFTNPNTGYTCPGGNHVYKTTNGGYNWFQQNTGADNYYHSVVFTDENTGFVAGDDGVILKTTNGGNVFVNNNNGNIPDKFSLYQNYPNPFNPMTKIKFEVPENFKFKISNLKLVVYDIRGKEITTLVNEKLNPGTYEVTFDARNLPSGIYFYQLRVGDFVETKNLILLK